MRRFLQDWMTSWMAFFGLSAPRTFLSLYARAGSPTRYIVRFWTTQNFATVGPVKLSPARVRLIGFGMLAQLVLGLVLVFEGLRQQISGEVYIGTAVAISYPVVWAHIIFLAGVIGWLLQPKKLGKAILCNLLEWQVRRLRARHTFRVIAVAGSIGKTSTKLAVAHVLGGGKRVLYQNGNYNDRLTVPLIFFEQTEPSIFNIWAWLRLLRSNGRKIRRSYPYDFVVVELGTDGPGQLGAFAYLRPEIVVVTAVAPEHMEYFHDLGTVAAEELSVSRYAQRLLLSHDAIDAKYYRDIPHVSYGAGGDYQSISKSRGLKGQTVELQLPGERSLSVAVPVLGKQGTAIVLAATAVADAAGLSEGAIKQGLETLPPTAGRMQILAGIKQSTVIDDTYNASPVAVAAALDVLYVQKAPQRIAILGSMNELGDTSRDAHTQIGTYCDPKKLAYVVTVGVDAKKYLAPAAKKAGCKVKSFLSPHEAGTFVARQLKSRAVVLAKGSQNGVFAEEAIKPLLNHKDDESRLVRQSAYWLKVKRSQFGG